MRQLKTFVLLGFSFTDPNIDYILARICGLMGANRRSHYCIMKEIPRPSRLNGKAKAEYEYQTRKLDLRIDDLQRYGIQTVLVSDYGQITTLLEELNRRVCRKNIFVSGSAHDCAPLGQARIEGLTRRLGAEIIQRGYNLTSGFGLGIGGYVMLGAIEEVYKEQVSHLDERTTLRPFPQHPPSTMTRSEMKKHYRTEMIESTGFAVLIWGNKLSRDIIAGVRQYSQYPSARAATLSLSAAGTRGLFIFWSADPEVGHDLVQRNAAQLG